MFAENNDESLDHDWFTEYFEEEHANKSKMAQDFTPSELGRLVASFIGKANKIADVCAGTGGLTISMWVQNPDSEYICYEYSERAIPLLLLNLSIRNINATVIRCDVLTGEEFEAYKVIPCKKYGKVETISCPPVEKVGAVISNPPYSLKYKPESNSRFFEYRNMLPTNFADYVFVAFALTILEAGGRAGFILPHGVLFRSNKEGMFRTMLCKNGFVKSVVGLPDKLFLNTGIPVCVLVLQNNPSKLDGILFIDAKNECSKYGRVNKIESRNFEKILAAYRLRENIEKFSHLASLSEIERNDYNLNIPRYVNTFEREELPDPLDGLREIAEINKDIYKTEAVLFEMFSELYSAQGEENSLEECKKMMHTIVEGDGGQLYFKMSED